MDKIYLIILLLTFLASRCIAQPYLYFSGALVDSSHIRSRYWFYNINRINLETSEEEIFLYNGYYHQSLTWDPTQTWLIVDFYGCDDKSELYKCEDTLQVTELAEGINGSFERFLYNDLKDEIYLLGYHEETLTFDVFNLSTKHITNSIPIQREDIYYDQGMFFSADKEKIYLQVSEHGIDDQQVLTYSVSLGVVLSKEKISNCGYPNATSHILIAGRDGKGVIRSYSESDSIRYIRIYDFDKNLGSPFTIIKKEIDPYYINERYFLAATYGYNPEEHTLYLTGELTIYDSSSAQVKILNLPPYGEIYTFDSYPNNFYYYLDSSKTVYKYNINSIVNDIQENKK